MTSTPRSLPNTEILSGRSSQSPTTERVIILSMRLLMRAGYGLTTNPVNSRDVTFNILAPGVVRQHLTLGGTYNMSRSSEITAALMHAANNDVSGPSLYQDFGVAAGNEKIEMYQNSLGVAWSQKW